MSGKIFKEKQEEKVVILETCSHCHKQITPEAKKGSFTSFLFSDSRCSCNVVSPTKLVAQPTHATPLLQPIQATESKLQESTSISSNKPDLGERYEVIELIGQGGMGAVWKVRDKAIGKTLAIKVLRHELANDKVAVKRFEQEAQAASCLTQANLCAVYGSGTARDNSPYLIMDYLDGENLADLLAREVYLPVPRALDIAAQVCEALAHAHAKGIVHRDLKPSNIIITKSIDGNDIVKIVDFGIAKLMPSINEQTNNLTQTGDLFGSPLYMSPEQCTGEHIDARSDIYSFGCVLYEMLTGKAAFAAENPIKTILKHINEEPVAIEKPLPAGIAQVLQFCLKKEPESRYQSMAELQRDLELVLSGNCLNGREPELSGQLTTRSAWRRVGAELIDALIVGAVSGFISTAFIAFLLSTSTLSSSSATVFYSSMYGSAFLVGVFDCATVILSPIILLTMLCGGGHSPTALLTILLFLLLFVLNWLYHAIFESSKLQGTIGQRLLNLHVTDSKGRCISFTQASLRHFAKMGSFVGFTEFCALPLYYLLRRYKKIWTPNLFDIFVRRTLQDRVSGTFVLCRPKGDLKLSTRWLTGTMLLFLLSISMPPMLFLYENRDLPFNSVSWRTVPEMRTRMFCDLVVHHRLKGMHRSELYSLLGQPDAMISADRIGWKGSTNSNASSGDWHVFVLKNDRVVDISGGVLRLPPS